MQRKYIYIVVVIFTVALIIADHYIGLKNNEPTTKEEFNIEDLEEPIKQAELKSPLVIKNFQNDKEKVAYTYKIKITNLAGAHKYTYNDEEGYIIFAANGEAEVSLYSNESITIYDIPQEYKYKIEQVTDVSDKYTTTIDSEKRTIIKGTIKEENLIEFENETIIKKEEPVKKNPTTTDNNFFLALFVFIYSTVVFIVATNIKVKRFE